MEHGGMRLCGWRLLRLRRRLGGAADDGRLRPLHSGGLFLVAQVAVALVRRRDLRSAFFAGFAFQFSLLGATVLEPNLQHHTT